MLVFKSQILDWVCSTNGRAGELYLWRNLIKEKGRIILIRADISQQSVTGRLINITVCCCDECSLIETYPDGGVSRVF